MGWLTNAMKVAPALKYSPLYFGSKDLKRQAGNLWNDATGVTASRDASRMQQKGLNQADEILKDSFGKAQEYLDPVYNQGMEDYSTLRKLANSGQFDTPVPTYNQPQFNFQEDPGYQFRMNEGIKALDRSASARGTMGSGGTLKALMRYGQDMGSQEYGNAYGRFSNDRSFGYGAFSDDYSRRFANNQNRFNQRSNLAAYGPASAGTMANQATTLGGLLAGNRMNAADANAAGRVGQYNSQRDTLMGLAGLTAKGAGAYYGAKG